MVSSGSRSSRTGRSAAHHRFTLLSLSRIREQVPSLAPGAIPDLQCAGGAQCDQPTYRRSFRYAGAASGTHPGTVEVELRVRTSSLHGGVELNDRYSVSTSRLRFGATLRYDNLWQKEHSVSLQYQTSPEIR